VASQTEKKSVSKIVIIIGLILVSSNVTIPPATIGPVIGSIKESLNLTNSQAGLLTTLLLVATFLFTPVGLKMASRCGYEKTMFLAIVGLFLAQAIRPMGGALIMFAGTFATGAFLSFCTGLLPSYMKKHFYASYGLMVSLRIFCQNFMSIIATASSVPLADGLNLGWRKMFILWSLFAAVTALVWIPQLRIADHQAPSQGKNKINIFFLLQSSLAWNISLYLGAQSFIWFGLMAWLPSILKSYGMGEAEGGYLLALYQMSSLPVSLVTPALAQRMKNQKLLSAVFSVLYVAGLSGLLLNKSIGFITVCIVIMGISSGLAFSLSMLFVGEKGETTEDVNALSGLSQIVSSIISAIAPFLIGWFFDITGTWTIPIILLISAGFLLFVTGFIAGSDRKFHLIKEETGN
jgi:CP family cyanate transporter-like MFS transporter